MPGFLFNKVEVSQPENLSKKKTLAQAFPIEFCAIFKVAAKFYFTYYSCACSDYFVQYRLLVTQTPKQTHPLKCIE